MLGNGWFRKVRSLYPRCTVLTFFFFVLLREAAKPPSQPTHKVAVHIPSQQDMESDSDIEEVSYPQISMRFFFSRLGICLFPCWVAH